jgi:hypothetical protein
MSSNVQIETFECQEVASEPTEISQEAADLIHKLGLDGQKDFLPSDEPKECRSRSPYRVMTKEEEAVYGTLCPIMVKAKNYSDSPIPVRVLQIGAHASACIPNLVLYVWDKEKSVVHDPVLVGYVGEYYMSGHKKYILARWGAELDTFATLRDMAVKVIREKMTAAANRLLAQLKDATSATILNKRTETIADLSD